MKYLTEVEGTKACPNSDFFLSWLHGFGKYKSEFQQNASEIIP